MSGGGERAAIPVAPLALFLLVLAAQRIGELVVAARNARRLLARGAREHGREHYPLLVLLHVLFPLALVAEVVALGARPGGLAPLWLGLWLAAQGLRYAAMRALGEHWNTRVLVLPGAPLVRRGPYRWLRHPNYLAVVIEFVAAPAMFGAWRTALAFSLANLLAMRVRIRSEERALAGTAVEPPPSLC
jgi:methyltransferase